MSTSDWSKEIRALLENLFLVVGSRESSLSSLVSTAIQRVLTSIINWTDLPRMSIMLQRKYSRSTPVTMFVSLRTSQSSGNHQTAGQRNQDWRFSLDYITSPIPPCGTGWFGSLTSLYFCFLVSNDRNILTLSRNGWRWSSRSSL